MKTPPKDDVSKIVAPLIDDPKLMAAVLEGIKLCADADLYGPSKWLAVEVEPTPLFMETYFGPRCVTYEEGCPCCDGYASFDATGKVDVLVDNGQLLLALLHAPNDL